MSFKKFCPKCGKDTDVLLDDICKDCFLQRNPLFSVESIDVKICKVCGKYVDSGKRFDEEMLKEKIVESINIIDELKQPKVFVELEKHDAFNYTALIEVKGIILDDVVEDKKEVKFQLKETTCEGCMRLGSNYREAILQLRGDDDTTIEMFEFAKDFLEKERRNDSLSGTSKIIELKNGFDLWVGSRKAALKTAKELKRIFSGELKTSRKLIGQENGKRKYRITFCVKA